MSADYAQRGAANDESRNRAERHATDWTGDDVVFLEDSWDGTDETLAVIAELLGRTIEACRQKHYTVKEVRLRAQYASPTAKQSRVRASAVRQQRHRDYIGAHDDPDEVWWA